MGAGTRREKKNIHRCCLSRLFNSGFSGDLKLMILNYIAIASSTCYNLLLDAHLLSVHGFVDS